MIYITKSDAAGGAFCLLYVVNLSDFIHSSGRLIPYIIMKKLFVTALLLASSLSFTSAQWTSITSPQIGDVAPDQSSAVVCTDLTYNLTYKKSKDSNTNGQVSDLQNFLQDQELLSSDPTGYYGALTFQAVKIFQTKSGLLASGYVGPPNASED